MRRVLFVLALFVTMTTACAPAAATEEPAGNATSEELTATSETERPDPTGQPATSPPEGIPTGPGEQTVVKQLATSLGLEVSEISVLSSEEVEFGNACLDVAMEGIMCAQVITPGRIIVLEAEGLQYAYHTTEDGSRVQPATLALVWKREGGIAGFCDLLTVFRSGEVFASRCKSEADGKMSTLATLLSAQERRQFQEWMRELGEAELDASDPRGVSDRMEVTLKIVGHGEEPPTTAQQEDLFEFAQDLYQKVSSR